MATSEKRRPKPVVMADRRVAGANRRIEAVQERLRTLEDKLDEMTEDRNRWRKQAESLAAALMRIKSPVHQVIQPIDTTITKQKNLETNELLRGMQAISDFLGIKRTTGYRMVEQEGMPTFKLAGQVCARPSALNAWLTEREATARASAAEATLETIQKKGSPK